ncbi:hypothetical protein L210DRAFT_3407060 [Boletus edulis BED1]|uniref:Uncharacterized protein n=1 Tax=Boletus edulis BED1 TaxID=1328754 RepID=A0AAD4BPL4_BOLED|nr:hypothetical protein L210DRAFT_3407060 [Boletus edulis BED1]
MTYPAAYPALTSGQSFPVVLHPEHVVLWYLVCWDAVVLDGPRRFVPQTIYQPHSQGDKERYVSLAKLHSPIIFITQDSPEWGVPIQHLLSRQLVQLVDGNDPAFTSCGPSIGIRLQWPGYQPLHKQVGTRDYTHQRRMITKAKLAKIVARCVRRFMDTMSGQAMQIGSDNQWRIGPVDIRADDIVLVSLHHVSQGSWQPHLRLRRGIGTNITAGPQGHRRF